MTPAPLFYSFLHFLFCPCQADCFSNDIHKLDTSTMTWTLICTKVCPFSSLQTPILNLRNHRELRLKADLLSMRSLLLPRATLHAGGTSTRPQCWAVTCMSLGAGPTVLGHSIPTMRFTATAFVCLTRGPRPGWTVHPPQCYLRGAGATQPVSVC